MLDWYKEASVHYSISLEIPCLSKLYLTLLSRISCFVNPFTVWLVASGGAEAAGCLQSSPLLVNLPIPIKAHGYNFTKMS